MPACQPLAIHNSIPPDVLKFAHHMTYQPVCGCLVDVLGPFFMSRAYGGEGQDCSSVQQDRIHLENLEKDKCRAVEGLGTL